MTEDLPEFGDWSPLSIANLQKSLAGLQWILAGGYALEYFYGTPYRSHGDIDILINREKQHELNQYLEINRIYVAEKPGMLFPFSKKKYYSKPIQDIWVLSETYQSWCLQIMLYDILDDYWVYKRDDRIRMPIHHIIWQKESLKILRPEIQLLYKSKNVRSKDQFDFEKIYPLLSENSRQWLQEKLQFCYDQHPWIE